VKARTVHRADRTKMRELRRAMTPRTGSGSAKTVEATLAQWLGFQVGRATWPLTTARAPKTPLSPC
jgi:hypothetical protein